MGPNGNRRIRIGFGFAADQVPAIGLLPRFVTGLCSGEHGSVAKRLFKQGKECAGGLWLD